MVATISAVVLTLWVSIVVLHLLRQWWTRELAFRSDDADPATAAVNVSSMPTTARAATARKLEWGVEPSSIAAPAVSSARWIGERRVSHSVTR